MSQNSILIFFIEIKILVLPYCSTCKDLSFHVSIRYYSKTDIVDKIRGFISQGTDRDSQI